MITAKTAIAGGPPQALCALAAAAYGATSAAAARLPPARRGFYALAGAAAAALLLTAALMAYGTFRKKPKLMWPWVVSAWCLSVLLVGMAILGTVLLSLPMDRNVSTEISSMISVYFIYGVVLYYSASVVESRRLEMAAAERRGAVRLVRQSNHPKSLFIYEDIV